MRNTTYDQKLSSPQWAKKRRDILDRDKHRCKHCGATEVVLQVHHTVYLHGCQPWEYPNDSLITLCQPCHKKEERYKKEIEILVFDLSYRGHTFEEIFQHLEKLSHD